MLWVAYRRDEAEARAILDDQERANQLLESDGDGRSVDLDKSWHGLHWLLTGDVGPTADPLGDAIMGGEPIGEDLGMGPGRLVVAQRVAEVAAALDMVTAESLRARLDSEAMNEAGVYPDGIWDEADIFDDYLWSNFEDLRVFYRAAAAAGHAVIQTIC